MATISLGNSEGRMTAILRSGALVKSRSEQLLAGRGYKSFEVALLGALKLLRKLELPIEISICRPLEFGAHWFELAPKERLPENIVGVCRQILETLRERQVRLAPGRIAPSRILTGLPEIFARSRALSATSAESSPVTTKLDDCGNTMRLSCSRERMANHAPGM